MVGFKDKQNDSAWSLLVLFSTEKLQEGEANRLIFNGATKSSNAQ